MNKQEIVLAVVAALIVAFTVFVLLDSQNIYQEAENNFSCPQGSTVLESSMPTNTGEKTCIPVENKSKYYVNRTCLPPNSSQVNCSG